ncbi:MAG: class I SAM-dependent DNA methyltransferase, partial [Candidatus Sumerlaeota bacterium]|nr:class I SAM-dependent DNA methyltransferase [Candidatus Sumerlaeota bacterium]
PVTGASLSRVGWTDPAKNALAEDPLLWAAGGAGDAFHVIYARLASSDLKRTLERPVVERLLREHPYAFFVFSNDARNRWHFVNVKYDPKVEKRQLYRRITVGPEERLRTAAERIAMLDLEDLERTPPGKAAPLAIQERHDDAFDVEKVAKAFFRTLFEIYESNVVPDIQKEVPDETAARQSGLILLNRLLFLYFIQKKGWLDGTVEYLPRAFGDHRKEKRARSYYADFLVPLFQALSTPKKDRGEAGIPRPFHGIPFLNGGLFEPESVVTRDADLRVTNATFALLFDELLERFNFTVTEDTPLDVEVAVDPEMLGKIFEELVTGRHETGAYYTPRPVVSFMCREALKGFLNSAASSSAGFPAGVVGEMPAGKPALRDAIGRFVDSHDASGLRDPEAVLQKLRAVRVCDPACGSGAYLVGMLQELLALRHCLFAAHQVDARDDYNRKLDIIQNNLYGVDIDPVAVNIARLRLWLTLAVEYDAERSAGFPAGSVGVAEMPAGKPALHEAALLDPPPLPNLDFKIEQGDSVLSASPKIETDISLFIDAIRDFAALKERYLKEVYNKPALKRQLDELRSQIAHWIFGEDGATAFDWRVDFVEVMAREGAPGFDIVLANPPYVRQEIIRLMKPRLKALYPDVYTGTADLFTYFFARALELLRPSNASSAASSSG